MQRISLVVVAITLGTGCAPEVSLGVDLQHANLRVPFQTEPNAVVMLAHDVDVPYDVLSDLEVTLRQRSSFGDLPTRELATRTLQERAARIGAHAVIMISFGEMGMSLWSYKELRGHGRAIRFR